MKHKPNVGGFLPEPDKDSHWLYENKVQAGIKVAARGKRTIDLRAFTSPRHNQRDTNSCVGQSVVKALEIKRIMKYGQDAHTDLSVLAVYYLARDLMNPKMTNKDQGTYVSLACDVLRRFGVCPEGMWPFKKKNLYVPPTWNAMRKAYKNKISSFYKISSRGSDRVEAVKDALLAGNPVVYGTAVDDSWYKYNGKGKLTPVNDPDGFHATVLLGWDGKNFIGENSWGQSWGSGGFYYMDPSVISHRNSYDFWIIAAGWEDWAP